MNSMLLPVSTKQHNCPAEVFPEDLAEFGIISAAALSRLAPNIATLNRVYRRLVGERALSVLPEIEDWLEQSVNVFLRHDAVFVFAIHQGSRVGMANAVELRDVKFVVDETGRQQTLRHEGTLSNLSTVHAFVAGTACRFSNEAPEMAPADWHPVLYRPDLGSTFMTTHDPGPLRTGIITSLRPVYSAQRVLMIPGRVKVWCQSPVTGAETACGTGRPGETL